MFTASSDTVESEGRQMKQKENKKIPSFYLFLQGFLHLWFRLPNSSCTRLSASVDQITYLLLQGFLHLCSGYSFYTRVPAPDYPLILIKAFCI
jgi:hypothetical protein